MPKHRVGGSPFARGVGWRSCRLNEEDLPVRLQGQHHFYPCGCVTTSGNRRFRPCSSSGQMERHMSRSAPIRIARTIRQGRQHPFAVLAERASRTLGRALDAYWGHVVVDTAFQQWWALHHALIVTLDTKASTFRVHSGSEAG